MPLVSTKRIEDAMKNFQKGKRGPNKKGKPLPKGKFIQDGRVDPTPRPPGQPDPPGRKNMPKGLGGSPGQKIRPNPHHPDNHPKLPPGMHPRNYPEDPLGRTDPSKQTGVKLPGAKGAVSSEAIRRRQFKQREEARGNTGPARKEPPKPNPPIGPRVDRPKGGAKRPTRGKWFPPNHLPGDTKYPLKGTHIRPNREREESTSPGNTKPGKAKPRGAQHTPGFKAKPWVGVDVRRTPKGREKSTSMTQRTEALKRRLHRRRLS